MSWASASRFGRRGIAGDAYWLAIRIQKAEVVPFRAVKATCRTNGNPKRREISQSTSGVYMPGLPTHLALSATSRF